MHSTGRERRFFKGQLIIMGLPGEMTCTQSTFTMIAVAVALCLFTSTLPGQEPPDDAKTIEKIDLLRGKIVRDEKRPGRPVVALSFNESHRFSDKYMHLMKEFKYLESLNLTGTRVTDVGLKELAQCGNLKELGLASTQITDAGLKELKGLKNLKALDLSFTQITDVGLGNLRECKSISILDLGHSTITDAGLKDVGHLGNLTALSLIGTPVTDVGIKELSVLENLTSLRVLLTEVTERGAMDLKQSLPKLVILR